MFAIFPKGGCLEVRTHSAPKCHPLPNPVGVHHGTSWESFISASVRQDDSPGTVAGPKYVNEEEVLLTTITLKVYGSLSD